MSSNKDMSKKEAAFGLAALMEIPLQYRATQGLRPIEKRGEKSGELPVLPPPPQVLETDNAANSQTTSSTPRDSLCPVCLTNSKDMTFGCGHLTCKSCGATLATCPICRAPITMRVRLYS